MARLGLEEARCRLARAPGLRRPEATAPGGEVAAARFVALALQAQPGRALAVGAAHRGGRPRGARRERGRHGGGILGRGAHGRWHGVAFALVHAEEREERA